MSDKLHKALMDEGPCLGPEELSAYHEGSLQGDALRRVEHHLAHCDLCSEAVDGLLMAGVTVEEMEQDVNELNARAWQRVEEENRKAAAPAVTASTPTKRRRPVIWLAAASMALVATTSLWFYYRSTEQAKMQSVFAEQFQMPAADTLLLAEGSLPVEEATKTADNAIGSNDAEQLNRLADQVTATQEAGGPSGSLRDKETEAVSVEAVTELKLEEVQEAPIAADHSNSETQVITNTAAGAKSASTEQLVADKESRSSKPQPKKGTSNDERNKAKHVQQNLDMAAPPAPAAEKQDALSGDVDDYKPMTDSVSVSFAAARPAALVGGLGAYEAQDYRSAVEQFKQVLKADPSHQEANFYAGVSYLGLEDARNAIPCLEKARKGSNAMLSENAEWYLALAYLKNSQKGKAEPLLKDIEQREASPYRSRAAEVLDDLRRP